MVDIFDVSDLPKFNEFRQVLGIGNGHVASSDPKHEKNIIPVFDQYIGSLQPGTPRVKAAVNVVNMTNEGSRLADRAIRAILREVDGVPDTDQQIYAGRMAYHCAPRGTAVRQKADTKLTELKLNSEIQSRRILMSLYP